MILKMEKQSCFGFKHYILSCCVFLVTLDGNIVQGITDIEMSHYCDQEINMILQSVYQLRLNLDVERIFTASTHYSSYNTSLCGTHIEAWYNKPNIMFYIDELDLDCDDGYLQFSDGYSPSRVNVDVKPYLGLQNVCGPDYTKEVYTTNSRNLRIRYVARKRTWKPNVMSLIVTAFSEGKSCEVYEYECDNGRCIDEDVSCNDFNSCGDNSGCHLSVAAIVGIAIGGTVGLILIVSVIICVVCVAKRSKGRAGTTQNVGFQQQPVVYNPTNPQPIGYGAPPPGHAQYGFQPTNYGQPQPTNYGQPQPTNYGQPQPPNYGQPQPTNYGQPQPGYVYPTQSNNLYSTQALANPQVTEPK